MLSDGSDTGLTPLKATTMNYFFVVSIVLLCYDHILTFGLEIRLIWHRPFHIVAIVFLVNRYLSLIINVGRFAVVFESPTPRWCHVVNVGYASLMFVSQLLMWGLQIWRISALYGHQKKFLRIIIPFSLLFSCFALWVLVTNLNFPAVYLYGCLTVYTGTPTSFTKYYWIIFVIWEVIIVSLTINKTWKMAKASRDIYGRPFLSTIMLRDGLIYFLSMSLIFFMNIVTYFIHSSFLVPGSITWLSVCISIAMTSRIILNLKENMNATIVSGDEEHDTIDITMTHIISRQLENFDLESYS